MFRYLALAFPLESPQGRDTAQRLIQRHTAHCAGWSSVLIAPGLYVACAGVRPGSSEPYLLHEGGGVVLGKLFQRPAEGPSQAALTPLDESVSRRILASAGRHLIEGYWGRYVAFLLDRASSTVRVLRDPCAAMPCLMLRYGGVTLFFSSMEEVRHLGLPSFEVNWELVAASVCMRRQHTHGTGLMGVLQVLGGECVALTGERIRRSFHWNPVEIAKARPLEDPAEAARGLRVSVRDAVHAWASSYEGILLSLSGGLDSSIIAACLRDAPLRGPLTCFHYFPEGPDADERGFARRVAASIRRPLIERPREPRLSLTPLLQVHKAHQPVSYLYYLEHSRLDAQLAARQRAAAVFIGWGGDQVFYQSPAIWGAADYARRHGFRPPLWRIALDCARMDRISVWDVLREVFPGRARTSSDALREHRPLIRPEVIAAFGQSGAYLHPLLRDVRGIPPGKRRHMEELLGGTLEYYDPLGEEDDPEPVAPLYSQPVLETCLKIPTDVLTAGGWPRAVARHAFQHDLPPEIINRRQKGGIESHVQQILRHNITFVRELLLTGALVERGIVDRGKLEQVLSGGAHKHPVSRVELLEYLGIEVWLRSWQGSPPPPPSAQTPQEQTASPTVLT